MWTKKNDHAPSSVCAGFFKRMSQKGSFEKKIKFDRFFVSTYEYIIAMFLYHGPLPISTKAPHSLLPPQYSLDHVDG